MTAEELEKLRGELQQLEGEGRRDIAARIKTAREWGDLKENAEYHAAKEQQAHLETRILRLREQLRRASVIEVSGSGDVVEHGSTVSFVDQAGGEPQTITIVSPHDARPGEGAISPGQECTLWKLAQLDLGNQGMYNEWMFGSPGAVPHWTGFTIGYDIVKDYRDRHPQVSWPALTATGATAILAGSGYRPCAS